MEENNKIELTQEDYGMGKYIFSILKGCGNTIMMSWGFHSPVVVKLGLQFNVNGFKLKGLVRIVYDEGADLFNISLIGEDNLIKETLEGVYFDELLDVIDEHVERVDNYNERVDQEYNFTNNEEGSI